MERKNLLILANAAISIILIAFILHLVGAEQVLAELGMLDTGYLALSLACLFGMDLLMSYRIMILLEGMGVRLGMMQILQSHFVGMLLADFTPSRTGYFGTAAALRYNHGVPSEKALLSIFGPQVFDFAFKLGAGSLAMLYLMSLFIGPEDGWVLFLGSAIIACIIAVMLLVLFSKRFLSLFSFAGRIPLVSGLYAVTVRMQDSSHVVISKAPHIVALICASWAFRSFSWFFAAKAVGITLEMPYPEPVFYFFLQPLVTMLEFVPSPTIAGLGLSEGGSTLVFSLFGIGGAKAAAFALLVRFKTTLLHLPAVPAALHAPGRINDAVPGGQKSKPDEESGAV